MAYKNILVHAGGAAFAERMRAAVQLAEQHDAHLIGQHVTQPVDIPPYGEAQLSSEVLQAQERMEREKCEASQAIFDAAASGMRNRAEWRTAEGDTVGLLQLHGRHTDLVIMGQAEPGDGAHEEVVGRVVLSLGRPVFVVPYVGAPQTLGQRILVAWDGSRTAARAVGDAIGMMQGADAVSVLSLNPDESHADMAGVDIAAHLARHGITVDAQHLSAADVEVGAMLLSRAADGGADMIVMGAYGHARWRELVLGGVTEHILAHMTVPVLLSH